MYIRIVVFFMLIFLLIVSISTTSADHDHTHLTTSGSENKMESPHGSFASNTNACGQCHSLHRGASANLLKSATRRDTCFMCHDGRGSMYDVKNGKTFITTSPTTGVIVDNAAGGFNSLAGFTSQHLIEEVNAPPGGSGQAFLLVCTSCHNPHGTNNHRNLQETVNGKTDIVVEGSVKVSPFTNKEVVSYKNGMADFCSSCHNDYVYYHNDPKAFNKTNYRHPINVDLIGGTRQQSSGASPKSVRFDPTLFTTLPTEGVPSGAYPNPSTTVATGGTLSAGTYYYIVTAENDNGESHQGHVKRVTVSANNRVILRWKNVENALHYSVYRAGPSANEPTSLNSYVLVADSKGSNSHRFIHSNGTFTFEDNVSAIQSSTKKPPPISSNARVFCLTCHYGHGTKSIDAFTGESKLKRHDNMGVCQDCHKR